MFWRNGTKWNETQTCYEEMKWDTDMLWGNGTKLKSLSKVESKRESGHPDLDWRCDVM